MAKLDLVAGCKHIRPHKRPKWFQKLKDPDGERAVIEFLKAWHAGKLVESFGDNKTAAARYLKEATGTPTHIQEIRETITNWGTPNGPS